MGTINMERMDRRIKWFLLWMSLATLGFLTVAAYRENFLSPWRLIRERYAELLQNKAVDDRSRAIRDQFEIRIVQNVLPVLGTVDRCVTCHPGADDPRMGDEKQPFRTHPGKYLIQHPPEQYGCTICHRGQGRALVYEEAKAVGYHWDYPLLPIRFTQSSCGVCHTAEEMAKSGGEKYAAGRALFETKGCLSCHKLEGRGGSAGPVLDKEGLKVRGQLPMANIEGPHTLPQWLIEHFQDPQKVVIGSQMKPPQLSDDEIEQLTVFLLSLQQRDLPQTYLSPAKHLEIYKTANPDPVTGEQLYNRYCSTCHDTGRYTRYDKFFKQFFPAIRGVTFVQTAPDSYLNETIRLGHPGTLMSGWGEESGGLKEEERTKIQEYLRSVPISAQEKLPPEALEIAHNPDFKVNGNLLRGSALFNKFCSGCHLTGLAPVLFNPVFQKAATDGFIYVTIAYGRRNTPMPSFLAPEQGGLNSQDIADLTAYVHSMKEGNQAETQNRQISSTASKP